MSFQYTLSALMLSRILSEDINFLSNQYRTLFGSFQTAFQTRYYFGIILRRKKIIKIKNNLTNDMQRVYCFAE